MLKDRIAEARSAAPHMADYIDQLVAPVKERLELEEQTKDWVMPNGKEIGADLSADANLRTNLKAIAAGYEPTTPPSHWYCGTLGELRENHRETWPNKRNTDERVAAEKAEKARLAARRKQAEETLAVEAELSRTRVPFSGTIGKDVNGLMSREEGRRVDSLVESLADKWMPSSLTSPAVFTNSGARLDRIWDRDMYIDRFDFRAQEMAAWINNNGWSTTQRDGVAKFVAPLPRAAYDAYQEAKGIFGEQGLRIYSPDPSHFQETKLRAIDPVIIGCVGDRYYEVFRWDIDKDIATAINKVVK